jgi:hypothetical protein
VDLNKLTRTEQIISASAIVLFIASFLPWFKLSFLGQSASGNGWDVGFFWAGIPTLIGLAMLAHILVTKFGNDVKLPELPWPMVHMVGGIVAAVIVILKLLIGHEELGVDFDRAYGLFIAAIATLGLAYGGFMYKREADSAVGPIA